MQIVQIPVRLDVAWRVTWVWRVDVEKVSGAEIESCEKRAWILERGSEPGVEERRSGKEDCSSSRRRVARTLLVENGVDCCSSEGVLERSLKKV